MVTPNYAQTVRLTSGLEPRRVAISAASDAAAGNVLVPADPNGSIVVLGVCLIAADAVTATFYSGAADAGTPISGPLTLAGGGGFVVQPPTDAALAWFKTGVNQPLVLHLSAAVSVGGFLVYAVEAA